MISKEITDKINQLLNNGFSFGDHKTKKERDEIEWVSKYHKTKIYPLKEKINYKILNGEFPSISGIRI